jgi:hypothetical protein
LVWGNAGLDRNAACSTCARKQLLACTARVQAQPNHHILANVVT